MTPTIWMAGNKPNYGEHASVFLGIWGSWQQSCYSGLPSRADSGCSDSGLGAEVGEYISWVLPQSPWPHLVATVNFILLVSYFHAPLLRPPSLGGGVSIVGYLPIPLGQGVFSWTFIIWRLFTLSFQNMPTHVFQAFHKWSMLFLAMSLTCPLPPAFCPRLEVDPNLHII